MKSGWMNTIMAAVVGGIVGGVVAYLCMAFSPSSISQSAFPESVEKLKVGELIVSDKMLLWKDGDEDASLLIQNGGMLAKTRIIAQQLCGNAVLANCVLTTPDDTRNQLENCHIFTEMGSSPTEGGMLTVRSPGGGNVLANPEGVTTGLAYTISYTNQGFPVCMLRSNDPMGKRFLGQFITPPQGRESLTALLIDPSAQPQPTDQQMELSQNNPQGTPMNQTQGMPLPGIPMPDNPPNVPNTGIDQQAMAPTTMPR